MKKTAVIFPGQGSQYVGMGREFLDCDADARALMETAREVSGFPLRELCLDGPMEALTRALHLQPALTVTNLICWQQLRKALPALEPACFAGHSLGEYSALCAAGIVSPEDCLALVTRRGELMEREGRSHPGGMRAVLGLTFEQLEALLAGYTGGGRVVVANHNSEKQVVISGDIEGLDGFGALCRNEGAKVIPLQVSIANHSPLVAGAVADFAAFMAGITFRPPATPVLFNVTAAGEDDPAVIRDIMARQIISRVRWFEAVNAMIAGGVEVFVEAGPKTVLTGLMKKIVPRGRATCIQFDTPEGLDKVVAAIAD
ncbi:malonyl CoA-acyl carrier protein transacylase [bacterium BMS3Bbin14]|nr:malonyl CoA-acyl carrier protein transacylase [bacterium BMS3Abin13]GBE53149.1 malonyl CoA-acyl carrier protein transacylase [bacterium BMS3Bbin14]HDO30873.1 ACP S-malonyltransferase [Desulfobacteraceae bacterium]